MTQGVEYSSNNSGGDFWLTDDDWFALERDGWIVDWRKDSTDWNGRPYQDGRYMGQLATKAFLPDVSYKVAVARWQDVTGQWAAEGGCYCCGQPHNFYEADRKG